MTNMMRTYGKSAAILTLVGDALKAIISCAIGYLVMGQLGAYAAALERIFKKPVKECALYFIRPGRSVILSQKD